MSGRNAARCMEKRESPNRCQADGGTLGCRPGGSIEALAHREGLFHREVPRRFLTKGSIEICIAVVKKKV